MYFYFLFFLTQKVAYCIYSSLFHYFFRLTIYSGDLPITINLLISVYRMCAHAFLI